MEPENNANATTDNPATQGQPQGAEASNPLSSFAAAQSPAPNPLLDAANGTDAPAQGTDAPAEDPLAWLPEKFRAKSQDGTTLDYEASARRLAESYAHLERRGGAGELAPADVEGYKLVGEGLPSMESLKQHPDFNEFLNKAHAAGVNNAQLSLMVTEIMNQAQLNAAPQGMTAQECEAALREQWPTPAEYNANLSSAVASVRAVFKDPTEQKEVMARYGTDPKMLRLMAVLGKEVGEDRMNFIGQPEVSAQDIDSLMTHPGYRDTRHPEHKAIRAKVTGYFERQAGNSRVV